MYFIFMIAILAGATVVLSRTINYKLADKIGLWEGTFFNNIVGLLFSILFLFLSSHFAPFPICSIKTLPVWAYAGGLIGVIVVAVSNYITPKISAFYLTLIIFIGQIFAGIAIDFLTLNSIPTSKIIGGILVILGLAYNLTIDKKLEKKSSVK